MESPKPNLSGKTLALLISGACPFVLGLFLAGAALASIESYHEVKFDRSKSEQVLPGMRDDYTNWIKTRNENENRKYRALHSAEQAAPFIVFGLGLILVSCIPLGFGLYFRAEERKNPLPVAPVKVEANLPEHEVCVRCGKPIEGPGDCPHCSTPD